MPVGRIQRPDEKLQDRCMTMLGAGDASSRLVSAVLLIKAPTATRPTPRSSPKPTEELRCMTPHHSHPRAAAVDLESEAVRLAQLLINYDAHDQQDHNDAAMCAQADAHRPFEDLIAVSAHYHHTEHDGFCAAVTVHVLRADGQRWGVFHDRRADQWRAVQHW